jgi:hypothetical protein
LKFEQYIIEYIKGFENRLPQLQEDIQVLLPYRDIVSAKLSSLFYKKYYNDLEPRALILGINPGRHGAGLTGIPFTDPKRLKEYCQIDNDLNSHEPSSEFIYAMIEEYGGPELYYKNFFISSVSPVGFIKHGKNYNYYDDRTLLKRIEPYIIFQMNRLVRLPIKSRRVICLGEGKNYQVLETLNKTHKWFDEIIPLAHPRYVMQYKRKSIKNYIDLYINALNKSNY